MEDKKGIRILDIYERLIKNDTVNTQNLASQYAVSSKSIHRDIDDIRTFLTEKYYTPYDECVKYDKAKKSYYLNNFNQEWLSSEETLAVCKILLESRAFCTDELKQLIDKLIKKVAPNDRKTVGDIIGNEYHCYIPLQHGKKLLSPVWLLTAYINKTEIIAFSYKRKDGVEKKHRVKPVAIMFSEFYFYLISYMADDSKPFPTVFRIDRISDIKGTGEKFYIPYRDRFEDIEFRKRVQFMFNGPLKRVVFKCRKDALEAMLDKLPASAIIGEEDGMFVIRTESFGNGIDMWLRSQGENVHLFEESKC